MGGGVAYRTSYLTAYDIRKCTKCNSAPCANTSPPREGSGRGVYSPVQLLPSWEGPGVGLSPVQLFPSWEGPGGGSTLADITASLLPHLYPLPGGEDGTSQASTKFSLSLSFSSPPRRGRGGSLAEHLWRENTLHTKSWSA